jgi:hypothetical protein
MQPLQDEFDSGGDGGWVPADIQERDSIGDSIEMTELMNVVVRRHHLRGVDGKTIVERQH